MKSFTLLTLSACFICLGGLRDASGSTVSLFQIDTFQDGTTDNWSAGGGAPSPLNISTGGPTGVGDRFLEITADGSGPAGKLTTFNRDQWLGDYIGQNITAITMDLQNLGATTLTIRIAFKQSTFNGAPGYLSAGVTLLPGSGWQHETFQLTSATMIALGGPAAFNTFFTNGEAEFRIINELGATNLNGDTVTSQLGIDNIQAIPEPASMLLFLSAGGLFLFRRRFLPVRPSDS